MFQALALLLSFVLVATVGGVLAAGLVLPGVAVANGMTKMTTEAFDDLPTELDWQEALPEKSRILAADGTLLATFFNQNRVVVPLTGIAPIMQKAVIAVEDKRFYEHAGVDVQGMLRAAVRHAASTSQEGASTLTQQYVKNVLIEAALDEKDDAAKARALEAAREAEGTEGIARKLREAKLAITLEKTMTKDEILERYLNIAQFGSSVWGVEAAAERYFSVPAAELNYLQAATIAGITQSPTHWDPLLNPANAQERRNIVLQTMYEQDYITKAEYTAGKATPIAETMVPQEPKLGCMSTYTSVPGSGYFCDYVTKIIRNDPAFGETQEERLRLLYRGGLTITTTLRPENQLQADTAVKAGVSVNDPSGVGTAIVVVEPGTGQIVAMSQNRNYNNTQTVGPRDTSVNYSTSYTYGSSTGFAPGSTFKPFTLLEWLKAGHALEETVDASKMSYDMTEFNSSCGNFAPGTYKFANSEGGTRRPMTVLEATENSVNSGYIAMAAQLDLCNIMSDAADLGVYRSADTESATTPIPALPANVIGSDSVTPLAMSAAFAAFAADGVYCTPVAILSVTDPEGNSLAVPDANCHQAIESKYARAVNYALEHVWQGTASSLGYPDYTAAGKTGTTSANEDTWFVGYTPKLAAAVWVGYPEGFHSMNGATINGHTYYSGPYGSSIAAPSWRAFMDAATAGQDVGSFPAPDDDQVYGHRISVPSVIGLSESDARSVLEERGFRVYVSSSKVSSDLEEGLVAKQNPGSWAVKGSVITLYLSDGSQFQPPDPCQENPDSCGPPDNGGDDDHGGGHGDGGWGNG